MKKHVKDFLGIEVVEPIEMDELTLDDKIMIREMYCHGEFADVTDFLDISRIEWYLYEFMNREDIDYFLSYRVSCETFCVSENNYHCIMFTEEGICKDSLYRTMALAHELGHYIDFKHNFGYNRFEFDLANSGEGLLEAEAIAWKYARDILEVLGFDEWEQFAKLTFESLMTYAGTFEKTMELIKYIFEIAECRENGISFLEEAKEAIR